MKRHTLEEKLKAIQMVESGMSPRQVSKQMQLGHHSLYEWLSIYRERGICGLKNQIGRRKRQLSFEEKKKIVLECQNLDVPLYQISSRYGVTQSTLNTWLSKVRQSGLESLKKTKISKKRNIKNNMKRLPKEKLSQEGCNEELERLRKENELLRLENLMLKKVKALVEERNAQNRKIGHVSSKN